MGLTRLAQDPWSESHEVPIFTPPPIEVKSCHVPLTAERAEQVVRTHIERKCTAQLDAPEAAAHGQERGDARQRPGTLGGWTEAGSSGEEELLEEDDSGRALSPTGARQLLDADLLDAWMRGAGIAADEEGPASTACADGPRGGGGSRGRPASARSVAPLSRRLSCPEGLLHDDSGVQEAGPQDALEPLANHHTWMFNRSRWANGPGGAGDAGLLYSASNALQAQQHRGSYMLGGGEGWQPRDAASFLASNAGNIVQWRGNRLAALAASGAGADALRSLAAVIIQSYCRGWRARRQVARMRSALRNEETARKERAAAEALARERGVVRRQLRTAARDCLLAVQAQQDYERTRARLAAARGLGPGAAAAPPPEPPSIPPALWARCKALGQDPIQVLLDSGLMSHQIEDIISASQLASQLPRRAANAAARMSVNLGTRRSGGGGGSGAGRVSGGGRSSNGGASADGKGSSVSEEDRSARESGPIPPECTDPAAAAPAPSAPRLSLPGRGGPLVPRASAKQLQSLQVGPPSQMNTAQLVAQMLSGQQQQQQQQSPQQPQAQLQPAAGAGAGVRRHGGGSNAGTGTGMAALPEPHVMGAFRPSHGHAGAMAGSRPMQQLAPLPQNTRGQLMHGPTAGIRHAARRMSDFVGGAGYMPPLHAVPAVSLAAIGNAAAVSAAQPESRAPPVRARSMGMESFTGMSPVPPPQSLSPVRVVLPTLLESSDKAGACGGSMELSSRGSESMPTQPQPATSQPQQQPQQQQPAVQMPPHLPPHVHAPLTSASSSPLARYGNQSLPPHYPQSSLSGGSSNGSPAVRRRHSYVCSPVSGNSLPPTAAASNSSSVAGGANSASGVAPADLGPSAIHAAGGGAAAVALGRINSRGSHRSFTHSSLLPPSQGSGSLPPLLQAQGSWSGLQGSGSGAGSGASSGAASPSAAVTFVSLPGSGGSSGPATTDVPMGRLRRGSNLAPSSFSVALAVSGPHPPPAGTLAGGSPMTIRRLQSQTSSSSNSPAVAVAGTAALSSSPTAGLR